VFKPANKERWVSVLIFAVFTVTLGVLLPAGTAAEKVGPAVGNKAPDFVLSGLTSKKVELYSVVKENKVTLINFWGIWCPYCVAEIPELVGFYNEYRRRQVEILAVNAGDNPKKVPAFAKKNPMAFPILIDKNNAVSNLYQIAGFPTTIIIDRQGKIRDIITGAVNRSTLAAKVEAVLKEF
jgi:peroxiredoxin